MINSKPYVVGLIADTHCKSPDGSDLPQSAVDALRDCDLIVHLGDLTSLGVLDRLAANGAEVLAVRNPKLDAPVGTDPRLGDGPVLRRVGDYRLAMVREYPCEVDADVIAFGVPVGGGGHDHRVALIGDSVIVSPGSPNLPVRHKTVALLTFGEMVDVEIVHLSTV